METRPKPHPSRADNIALCAIPWAYEMYSRKSYEKTPDTLCDRVNLDGIIVDFPAVNIHASRMK